MKKTAMLLIFVSAVVVVVIAGCIYQPEEDIAVNVYVLKDLPESNYELREGTPNNLGVYEFYYKKSNLPGTGAFKKLDSIPLNKINETAFYGTKSIRKINGTLCIGYPSTNFIDGKGCVRVDQSQNETNITVHYWKTNIATI